jgi:hypothetical protein
LPAAAELQRSGQRSISVPSAMQMDLPNRMHQGFQKIDLKQILEAVYRNGGG